MVAGDESGLAQWSFDALAQEAKEADIRVKRSQICRILAPGRGAVAADAQLGHASRLGRASAIRTAVVSVTRPLYLTARGLDDRLH